MKSIILFYVGCFVVFVVLLFQFEGFCVIELSSIEEIQKIGSDPAYPSNGTYELTRDIDASDTVNWNDGAGYNPVVFTGVFDGKGHKVSNLFINRPDAYYVALFARGETTAEVRSLGLENVWIRGYGIVGGIIGDNMGVVEGCYVEGKIVGDNIVGGVCGRNSGSLSFCYSLGSVNANSVAGGLVGENTGFVNMCYSTGPIRVQGSVGGGLVGRNGPGGNSRITRCYSLGSVLGVSYMGGLVGINNSGYIGECYSAGAVSGDFNIGGLVSPWYCAGTVESSYWDVEVSGQTESCGGIGKTTAEMRVQGTYVGWCFDYCWDGWGFHPSLTYPYLDALWLTQFPPTPVFKEIWSLEDLRKIGTDPDYPWDGYYTLMSDIEAIDTQNWNEGKGFKPIKFFPGVFDGNGYVIKNLFVNRGDEDFVGLFGMVFGEVRNLGLENATIIGNNYVGGLVGSNNGTIHHCYVDGFITGFGGYCGGLAGENSGLVYTSYSLGSVVGNGFVGGFCGGNANTISTCYSVNYVGGSSDVGGFLGVNSGSVSDCYWDIDTSNQDVSEGGEGRTALQMMEGDTFTNWDFQNDWWIVEEMFYPQLIVFDRPVIVLMGSHEEELECGSQFVEPGVVAYDFTDGELTNYIRVSMNLNTSELGIYFITYSITDSEDRTSSITRTVNVVDTTPPYITLNGDDHITVECHTDFVDPGVSAWDNCSGDVSVEVLGSVDVERVGEYDIHYLGRDAFSNVSEVLRVVRVVDTIPPEIVILGDNPMVVECHTDFVDPGAYAYDLCDMEVELQSIGNVDTEVPGSYEVAYIAKDNGNNTSLGKRVVIVECEEGEGSGGSVEGELGYHSADSNGNWKIDLSELLRVIQFFNLGGYHCALPGEESEDGYIPGYDGDKGCKPHASDYNLQDWEISLSELLRLVQFFNSNGYYPCPEAMTEDFYCPGVLVALLEH